MIASMTRLLIVFAIGLAFVLTFSCIDSLVKTMDHKHDAGDSSGNMKYSGKSLWNGRGEDDHVELEIINDAYKDLSRRKAQLNLTFKNQRKSIFQPVTLFNKTKLQKSFFKKQSKFSGEVEDKMAGGNSSKSNSISLDNAKLNSTSTKCPEATGVDCSGFFSKNINTSQASKEFCYSPSDSLKCYQDPIFCETFHLSGKRELKWPAYGEYSYLPHKHWVKVLQHGGVVFLYHPCAQNSSVSKLRNLADSCMHRYVLTQYHKLTPQRPLALVSWGCFLLMRHVNVTESKLWIKSHAYKGPASHIHKNGTYEHQLVRPAKVLTDIKDTLLCPNETEKASLHSIGILKPTGKSKKLLAKHKQVGEEIILKRLQKAKHNSITHPMQQNIIPVDTKKSLAAFGSLVFLSVLLLVLLLYTKLWRPRIPPRRSGYVKLGDLDLDSEEQYYESNFSLLKTGQDFISSLKRSRKDRKCNSYSRVKLLAPISEDDYEMDDI